MGVGLGDNMRVVDTYLRQDKGQRSKSECHAMVFVGVDGHILLGFASLTIPYQLTVINLMKHISQFASLGLERLYTVGLLDLQGFET